MRKLSVVLLIFCLINLCGCEFVSQKIWKPIISLIPSHKSGIPEGAVVTEIEVTQMVLLKKEDTNIIVDTDVSNGAQKNHYVPAVAVYDSGGNLMSSYAPTESVPYYKVKYPLREITKPGNYTVAIIPLSTMESPVVHYRYAVYSLDRYSISCSTTKVIKYYDVVPKRGEEFEGEYELNERAEVNWRVLDKKRNPIFEEDHGSRGREVRYKFDWDGKRDDGNEVSPGKYSIEVLAKPERDEKRVSDSESVTIEKK